MEELDKKELQELLVKCWMTHDGTWFFSCMQEYGIEAANRLNKSAIKALAPIELRRVTRAMGVGEEGVVNMAGVRQVIDAMFHTIKGDFMDFVFDFPSEDTLRWTMNRCFALEGMKMIGAYDDYECGVLYRVLCWLDALGLDYEAEPLFEGCLMRETGTCTGMVKFRF